MGKEIRRCPWGTTDLEYLKYHDVEWGVPVTDDQTLFEFLILEGAQAGLSWLTILKRREGYKKAFANFEVTKVARFSEKKIEKLLLDPGIIRNKLKVRSAVSNAKLFIQIQKEFGSFYKYSMQFVNGKRITNKRKKMSDVPATTKESDAFSKDLKRRGFKFVGSTIIYAYMQAIGMVNDHLTSCFRYMAC
ncbi:MAG: DNA-3-methyladenine glycosylase I [Epsilonproteobacteria bacterium]|nr:MAG: DNA-3-methyladenine glycosylase I [Campylobacterota bacterium]RLA66342.1 MAG: DNA-3-methyladenine glycosylase I [Campylobacterota bacterium]